MMVLAAGALPLVGCGASLNSGSKTELTANTDSPSNKPAVIRPAGEKGGLGVGPGKSVEGGVSPPHVDNILSGNAYRIGNQDVLEITVFKVAELSKVAQVSDTGSVTYPLIGEVPAAGKTTQELERDLTAKLSAKYLQKPQVTVLVKEYNSQRVLVDGAVIKPGVYPVQGRSSLMQLIASSGGLTPNAETTVVVFRTVDGKKSVAKFNIDDIRSGKTEDPTVRAGDVIVASSDAFKDGLDKVLKVLPIAGVFALL